MSTFRPVQRLNLLRSGAISTREGHVGANSFQLIPGIGYYNPAGKQLSFAGGTIKQDNSYDLRGTARRGTFVKDCCTCQVWA